MNEQPLLKHALGQALREARERTPGRDGRCLSQDGMSKLLSVAEGTIGAWERGEGGIPDEEIMIAWAEHTDTTYDALWHRTAELLAEEFRQRGAPGASG